MLALFVTGALILGWTWIGYPASLWLRARRPRPLRPVTTEAPRVTVIVVARDEEDHLPAKLASLEDGGIPRDRLEVIVVDDGSSDGTLRAAAGAGARAVALVEARGKAAAINSAVKRARHEILVLTDARQPIESGGLARLVAPFADPNVGAVGGQIVGAAQGVGGMYRRLDDKLRSWEACTGSAVGLAGALWACRRSHFPVLPTGLVLDDLYAPLVIARRGLRVVVAPDAHVIERVEATTPAVERRRRIRTLAGNFQLLARAPWLLVPGKNRLWWRFVSHKLLRLLGPVALAAVLVALVALAPQSLGWALLALAAAGGLALAALGHRAGPLGRIARGFVEAQLLVVIAAAHAVRGTTPWRPAHEPRPLDVSAEVSHGL